MNTRLFIRERLSSNLNPARWSRRSLIAGGVFAILCLAIGLYVTWVMSAVNKVEQTVASIESLDISAMASGDETALAETESALNDAEGRINSLSFRTGPVRLASATLGWMPILGDQVRAPVLLVEQSEDAVDTAQRLLPAVADLHELQGLITSTDFLSGEPDSRMTELIDSVEVRALSSSESLERLIENRERLNSMTLLPLFRSKADRSASVESRLGPAVRVVSEVPDLLRDVDRMGDTASELIAARESSVESFDLLALGMIAGQLSEDAARANSSATELADAADEALPGSQISALANDLVKATAAVSDLAGGLSSLVTAAQPAMEALRASEGPLLEDGDTLSHSLWSLNSRQEEIGEAVADIESGIASLESLQDSGSGIISSSPFVNDLIAEGESLNGAGALLRDGPALALDLIAADGEKTYLVLGQTSDELRAAGGFTSSAWTMKFQNGALVSSTYIPILQFDNQTTESDGPPAPMALSVHMDAGSLFLRDVGWDPHFPSVGELAAELYRLNQGAEIDGVISITQWGLLDLIESVGGIETEQGFVAPADVLQVIEQGTDTEGTGFLQYFFDGLVGSITGDKSDFERLALARTIWEIIQSKDLMLYSSDSGLESRLVSVGWGGEFPLDQADRLGVIDSNVGWTKSDRNIDREATYEVDLRVPESPQARLDLRYRHTGVPVGRDCSEQRTPNETDWTYELARNSCYWDFFRVYTAVGAQPAVSPDLPLPVNSIAERIGRLEAGSSTFSQEFDSNGDYFSGLFAIEPGQGEQFSISYDLPSSVAEVVETGISYRLNLVAQPGARGRDTTVRVLLPEGHSLLSSNHAPTRQSAGVVTFEFDLTSDQLLEIETTGSAITADDVFEAAIR